MSFPLPVISHIHLFLSRYYTVDRRALSLMRISIALLVLADLCIRCCDLTAHYTNEGMWPTHLLANFGWNPGYWSLHAFSGSTAFTVLLFVLHFLFAIGLLLGYKTRLCTLLVWLLTISLHNRNLFVLQGGDDLLRLILLWGVFLPWNAHYSLDALKTKYRPSPCICGGIAYLLLIASVYFFSANLKSSPEWHTESSAVYYALSLEQLRLPFGDFIYQYPLLLQWSSNLVLYAEYAVPLLVLAPSRTGAYRGIAFLILFFLHLCIGLSLFVGLFYLIGMASAIALLPPFVMQRFENILKIRQKEGEIIDKKSVLFVRTKNLLITALAGLCLFVNLGSASWFPYEMRDELAYPVHVLRLNQYWGMFSPGVLKTDGWFVYHGMDSIGRQWDMRLNQDYVDYNRPARIVSMYKNDRWRKLAENMQKDSYTFLRPLYCRYLLHQWNKKHPEKKLNSLSVYFMQNENLPDYKKTAPVKSFHCMCYDD